MTHFRALAMLLVGLFVSHMIRNVQFHPAGDVTHTLQMPGMVIL